MKREKTLAIFEAGVFKPVEHPKIREGQIVEIVIEPVGRTAPQDPLGLARRACQGLRTEEIDEIERIAVEVRYRPAVASRSRPME